MNMKRFPLAISLTALFLSLPITSTIAYAQFDKIDDGALTVPTFKVKLTEEEVQSFNDFIERITTVEDKHTAKDIANLILCDGQEINIYEFGEILKQYGFANVSYYYETTDIVDDVLNFILELIIERLGWVYDFLEITSEVMRDAQNLWGDKSLPKEIISELDLLIENLNELQTLTTLLIEGKYVQFLETWDLGLIVEDITEIIESIETIANDFGILAGDISRFVGDVGNLINWLRNKAWEHPIHVYGRVMESAKGLSNVTIRCRGVSSITDEEGNFSFFVNSTPDNHSIPPDTYFGIHQCIITAETKDILKEIPAEFSYVFSDGGIYWIFFINDDSVHKENFRNFYFHSPRLWSRMQYIYESLKDMR